ncbi:MAG: hypothetical protein US04_C0001G0516 [Candidatus Nomurabacteria bacterium GW2011_GWD2_36_14]|nr:MAG: hypothetical protein UR97_C0002G0145 [Candidatus Nomurabacteria bacterium GW2011_GWE2_36_115]KKP94550.1 MAG: hypothetical protein US00_C0001G0144 [Candidatus Nomurabacteria bacterium GW2011_GWF2_36_126]KKP97013.1 MAG: hypothetical protein US04_C0001G0516 [Candidatus Nomurabacteria bacterium GW2011_GWD2_36_14]KKP99383.1 MAG: hypothetical protein US08_C0001G0065 [Candidatus Nomurabacteria bacterium GW2011_GWF2_36_19]KKQ05760.1 MAG: hypothetical protein US17_C0002G0144 [Candidatus Nomuraba
MKTILAVLMVLIFCITLFGGIYFFHQEIDAKFINAFFFFIINAVIGTLMFLAVKSAAK